MKLYVGNLSFETTENDLQDLFEQHGTGHRSRADDGPQTGQSRGFGFVTMNERPSAKLRSRAQRQGSSTDAR